jgi:hypothetical protein
VTDLFEPGDAILYMKIGVHAGEPLSEIIKRKQQEIRDAGFAMWGYGGNTCHPRTMVQPFAGAHDRPDAPIRLVMQKMQSNHFADPVRAEEYSIDGETWQLVPDKINVKGSRFALCIKNLVEVETTLALGETKVALGNSAGRLGDAYVKGRVDKACLEVVGPVAEGAHVPINVVADLVKPYAVILR